MGCLSLSAPFANEIRVSAESWEDSTETEGTSRGGWLRNRVSWGDEVFKINQWACGNHPGFCVPFLELSLNPEG